MWQPIDLATPRDRPLLLWVPSEMLPPGWHEARKLDWPREDRATHWMTLPPRPSLMDE